VALGSVISSFPPATVVPGALEQACNSNTPGIACRLVWDLSHSVHAADFTTVYLAGPIRLTLRIVLVLLVAVVLRIAAGRLIRRLAARVATGQLRRGMAAASDDGPSDSGSSDVGASDVGASDVGASEIGLSEATSDPVRRGMFGERRRQRATALASVLGNAASVTIFTVAGVIILGDLGLNLAPVLASAGVLGIAIGFGAQNLVQDFLAGIFMLLEDQYGVGDVVDIGSVAGTVEAVSLRITRLRDINGVVWHIRNGTIKRAGNETHGWARAVVDFPVPYDVPVGAARAALERAAVTMWQEPAWRAVMLDRPQVWGVEDVTADTVVIRVTARTAPQGKLDVARTLRERLKDALDAEASAPVPALAATVEPELEPDQQ
jgi:small-conductance mechanosensitive channel